jgi:hypothetical protein
MVDALLFKMISYSKCYSVERQKVCTILAKKLGGGGGSNHLKILNCVIIL